MTEHEYACPTPPNEGVRIVHMDVWQTWLPGAPVIPGAIWCWSHGGWEDIPQSWREEETRYRQRVLREWGRRNTPESMNGDFFWSVQTYCGLRGWKLPDFSDQYAMARFVNELMDLSDTGKGSDMFVLSVVHPPEGGAKFGRAVTLNPVRAVTRAAKEQAVYLLVTEGGLPDDDAWEFGSILSKTTPGTLLTDELSGLSFRIDSADDAPHPCPCCDRLVLPDDHAYASIEDAFCLGCFKWKRGMEPCLPEDSAHSERETTDETE